MKHLSALLLIICLFAGQMAFAGELLDKLDRTGRLIPAERTYGRNDFIIKNKIGAQETMQEIQSRKWCDITDENGNLLDAKNILPKIEKISIQK